MAPTSTSGTQKTASKTATAKKQAPKKTTRPSSPKSVSKSSKSANGKTSAIEIPRELIEKRAFEIWQEEGCPEQREDSNWLQAEKELKAKFVAQ